MELKSALRRSANPSVVCIIGYKGQRCECVYYQRTCLLENESAYLVEEDLFDFRYDFRILFFQFCRSAYACFQERISASHHCAQGYGCDYSKPSFKHEPPYVWVLAILDDEVLDDEPGHHACLVAVGDFVFLLVGGKKHLLVVDEIGQEGRNEKDSERCVSIPQREFHLGEYEWKECA